MATKIGLKYVQVRTSISPSTLRVCSGNHRVRAIRRKLELFDSVAQEQDRFQPVSILNHIGKITTCQTAIEELKIKSSWATPQRYRAPLATWSQHGTSSSEAKIHRCAADRGAKIELAAGKTEAQERLGNTRWIDTRLPKTMARGLLIT
jgi:hypothetical protein